MTGGLELGAAVLAAAAAGAVNALAGGGTLITFPTLLALGLPAVSANVTSTVALCPGYLGACWGQKRDLAGQSTRLAALLPAAAGGGAVGGWLLLVSGDRLFTALIPYLLLLASVLLAAQEPVRRRLGLLTGGSRTGSRHVLAAGLAVLAAAVYGGYFGAGLSVIVLATLAVCLPDSLTRLNALKQAVALAANVAAATVFAMSGPVDWPLTLTMAAGALIGGAAGGRWAGRVAPARLRQVVVALGVGLGLYYLIR